MENHERQPKRKGFYPGWEGGPGRPRGQFVTYDEAREWVSRLKLSNYKQWLQFAQARHEKGPLRGLKLKPRVIPANPQCTYRDSYVSDSHFLGHIDYLKYDEVKKMIHPLKLKSSAEWIEWHKINNPWFSPRYPFRVYEEWESWGSFLGNGNISKRDQSRKYRPFNEAVKFVHTLRFESEDEYKEWHRDTTPDDLPANPERVYADWQGWPYFLGKTIDRRVTASDVSTNVLAILQYPQYQQNVIRFVIEGKGKSEVLAKQKTQGFKIIKTYILEPQYLEHVKKLIKHFGTTVPEGKGFYLVSNLSQLLFELDTILLWA